MGKKEQKLIRGDKLRDLLFFVYLNSKFGKSKITISDLKKTIGYSTGGVYGPFESGYLEKKNDEVFLTEKGKEYVKYRILPQHSIYGSVGNILIMLGFVFLFQWFEWTYFKNATILPLYSVFIIMGSGFVFRFFALRIDYYVSKRRKKIDFI